MGFRRPQPSIVFCATNTAQPPPSGSCWPRRPCLIVQRRRRSARRRGIFHHILGASRRSRGGPSRGSGRRAEPLVLACARQRQRRGARRRLARDAPDHIFGQPAQLCCQARRRRRPFVKRAHPQNDERRRAVGRRPRPVLHDQPVLALERRLPVGGARRRLRRLQKNGAPASRPRRARRPSSRGAGLQPRRPRPLSSRRAASSWCWICVVSFLCRDASSARAEQPPQHFAIDLAWVLPSRAPVRASAPV